MQSTFHLEYSTLLLRLACGAAPRVKLMLWREAAKALHLASAASTREGNRVLSGRCLYNAQRLTAHAARQSALA